MSYESVEASDWFAAEKAKRQEVLYTWPGVKDAGYNSIVIVDDPVGPSD